MASSARLDARDWPFEMCRGQRWIELRIPGADTRLVLFTPGGHENRIGTDQNVVFWADDVEKSGRTCQRRG